MSLTARARVPHCSEVAWPAASEAATGSKPRRSSLSDCSCAARSELASRQRISRGSKTFHADRASTVTPTRRRERDHPHRLEDPHHLAGDGHRDGVLAGEPLQGEYGARAEIAADDAAADVVERPAVQLARERGSRERVATPLILAEISGKDQYFLVKVLQRSDL